MKNLLRSAALGLAFLAGILVSPLHSQAKSPAVSPNPPLQIFVDTAGVARWPEGKNTYVTWVFAKASATSLPSSGILVAFNCDAHMVRRLAHIIYVQTPGDSTSVGGTIVEDAGPWVTISIPKLSELVCSIGSKLPPLPMEPNAQSQDRPLPPPSQTQKTL